MLSYATLTTQQYVDQLIALISSVEGFSPKRPATEERSKSDDRLRIHVLRQLTTSLTEWLRK